MLEIETARLRLRLFTSDDLDDLARLFSDPEVMTYLGVEPGKTMARDEVAEVLDGMINGWRKLGFGRWTVIHKETDHFIGLCGLKMLEGEPELIYVLEKAYWGQRLATEAARAALRYGFEEAKLERIVAVTRRENVASQRVMKSIGMRYEREGRYYGVDGLEYAISREEFEPDNSLYVLRRD